LIEFNLIKINYPELVINNYNVSPNTHRSHRLHINIAQRISSHGIEHILDRKPRRQLPDLEQIIDSSHATGRVIAKRNSPINLVGLQRVQDLPHPVEAIDHGVVLVKGRVVERREDVGPVAAHGVVAGAVDAESSQRALQLVLEGADGGRGGAKGEVEQVLGGEGGHGGGHGEVAALAARVELLDVGEDGEVVSHGGLDGAEVDLELGEWP